MGDYVSTSPDSSDEERMREKWDAKRAADAGQAGDRPAPTAKAGQHTAAIQGQSDDGLSMEGDGKAERPAANASQEAWAAYAGQVTGQDARVFAEWKRADLIGHVDSLEGDGK